ELAAIVESSQDAIISKTPDYLITTWNQAAERLFGYTAQEMIGHHVSVLITPEYQDEEALICQRIHHGERVETYETKRKHKDGRLVDVDLTVSPILDTNGRVIGASKILRDISDRKQAELALQQSEARYRNIIETTLEGVWMLDAEGKTTFVNQRMASMLGYTEVEMLGTALIDFVALEEQSQVQIYLQRRQQGIEEQHPFKFQRQDGSSLWAIVSATPLLDAQSNYVGAIGLLTDITQLVTIQEALKTSEMQLSSVLNSSLDGIMAFRAVRANEGTIIDFEWLLSNPTACELVGRQPGEMIGKRFLVEMPRNLEKGLFDQYVQVVETGEPLQREFHYNYNGVESWFEHIAVKLGDGFAVTFRNITAIKQSELALQQANQQLEERIADLNQRHAEMVTLSEISDFLQACLTVEEACDALSHLLASLFPSCVGGIFMTSASRNRVEIMSSWGDSLQSQTAFHPQDCWALRRGRTHSMEHNQAGLRCKHNLADEEIAATLCIPMIAQGETLGLFYLSTHTSNALPEAKQQLARTVAEQVALAIANLRLQETLQYQSTRDPLTGLFNRRYLEETLNQELSRAQRQQHPISVIMLDIDHFKRFNDTHGHEAGDYVLQTVSTLLKENVRSSDIACRYGGEEMILVLPDSSLEETYNRAEAIRRVISQIAISHNGQTLGSLTASFGIASFPQHGSVGSTLVQAADAALYRAKAAGRNQVVIAL
ncbi:MAG: PAS domain S-box protein, partial [Leptolyngbyaceae bacterium]|nr:PAS domain S-box protein [Leptolyngbyaceae bacterium]